MLDRDRAKSEEQVAERIGALPTEVKQLGEKLHEVEADVRREVPLFVPITYSISKNCQGTALYVCAVMSPSPF